LHGHGSVSEPKPADLLQDAVAASLETAAEHDRSLRNGETDNFGFNVLLNALCTVLQAIRTNEPHHHHTYFSMAVMVLRDDAAEEALR
jgi:hypothetical protein